MKCWMSSIVAVYSLQLGLRSFFSFLFIGKIDCAYKVTKSKERKQAFTPQLSVAAQNDNPTGCTLFIKEVANAHSKHIRDLMQASDSDILSAIHHCFYGLPTHSKTSPQFGITHVFLFITLRRFSCDSYFIFFIVLFDLINMGTVLRDTISIGKRIIRTVPVIFDDFYYVNLSSNRLELQIFRLAAGMHRDQLLSVPS